MIQTCIMFKFNRLICFLVLQEIMLENKIFDGKTSRIQNCIQICVRNTFLFSLNKWEHFFFENKFVIYQIVLIKLHQKYFLGIFVLKCKSQNKFFGLCQISNIRIVLQVVDGDLKRIKIQESTYSIRNPVFLNLGKYFFRAHF